METTKRLGVLGDLMTWTLIAGGLLWADPLREEEPAISNDLTPYSRLEAAAICGGSSSASCAG